MESENLSLALKSEGQTKHTDKCLKQKMWSRQTHTKQALLYFVNET
jgi:hypothetical protein